MSKHAPGPWRISEQSPTIVKRDFREIGCEDGELICSTSGHDNSGFFPSEAEGIANAILIAAAPDLLEALQIVADWMDSQADAQSKGGHATFDLMMLREHRDIARAAISKATGEKP